VSTARGIAGVARSGPLWVVVAAAMLGACAGGLPKVPATPETVLERADDLHRRGKNTQAAALYQAFVERYAGHDRADYAQYQLANCHFDLRDYALAAVEYQVVITNFGYSEWVDEALFQIGVSYWREAPKPARDQQKSVDALSRFTQFLQTYPESPRAPEARAYVRQINARLAEKAMTSARWYQRRHEFGAALIYCDKVIDTYPDNDAWVEALYLKGTILLARGENESAIAQFTRVLEYPEGHALKRDAQEKIRQARR
jgi:outer membrane protein assembly factor BamD